MRLQLSRFWWVPALVWVLSGAACDDSKPDTDSDVDTGAEDPDVPGESSYNIQRVTDPDACAQWPAARRFHQMSYFFTHDPFFIDGWEHAIERGILLVGGVDGDGPPVEEDYYNSTWVYDLTNRGPGICPWHLVRDGDALQDGGIARGTLSYDPELGTFTLVGGIQDLGNTEIASDRIFVLEEEALGQQFLAMPETIPGVTYSFHETADPVCVSYPAEGVYHPNAACYEIEDPCGTAPIGYVSFDACTGLRDATCGEHDPIAIDEPVPDYSGCLNDPFCTSDPEDWTFSPADIPDGAIRYHTHSGLSGFGAAYNPVLGRMRLYGGGTGCTGVLCSEWDDLFDADHGDGAQALPTALSPHLVKIPTRDPDAYQGWINLAFDARHLHAVTGWPDYATSGLRSTAAATTGLVWIYDEQVWTHDGGDDAVLIGGTRHQRRGPGAVYSLEPTTDPCYGDGWWAGSWDSMEPDSYFGDLDSNGIYDQFDAVVGNDEMVSIVEGSSYSSVGLDPPFIWEFFHAAAIGVEADAVVVAGGQNASRKDGLTDIHVVDLDQYKLWEIPGSTLPRYGAQLVFDPVEKRAYLFGGHDSDNDLYSIYSPNSVNANEGSSFELLSMDVELAFLPDDETPADLTAGTWVSRVSIEMEHTCWVDPPPGAGPVDSLDPFEGDHCFADAVTLNFAGVQEDEELSLLDALTVEVLPPDSDVWLPGGSRILPDDPESEYDASSGVHARTFRLPSILTDGDAMTVMVEFPVEVVSSQSAFLQPGDRDAAMYSYDYGDGGGCGPQRAFRRSSLPVWVGTYVHDVAPEPPLYPEVDRLHVLPPDGFTAIAFGKPEACDPAEFSFELTQGPDGTGACFNTSSEVVHRQGLPIRVLESAFTVTPTPLQDWLSIYADSCLSADVLVAIDDYATAGEADADLTYLGERLGTPLPFDSHQLVIGRPTGYDAVRPIKGESLVGLSYMSPFTKDGDFPDAVGDSFTPPSWASSALHEVAHAWTARRRTTPASGWLVEAFPTLLETMRYPNDGDNPFAMIQAVNALVHNTREGIEAQNLVDHPDMFEVDYRIGPYTLSQLHFAARAADSTLTDQDVWDRWRDHLWYDPAEPLYAELRDADIEHFVDTHLAVDYFYTEWIQSGRVGTPLLALNGFDPDGAEEASVKQVQTNGMGWEPFTKVPFALGCTSADDPTEIAFVECGVSKAHVGAAALNTVGDRGALADATQVSLTPAVGVDATPTWVAVYAGPLLVPESLPTYGVSDGMTALEPDLPHTSAPTWLLYCAPSDSDDRCPPVGDADGDGYPMEGDCMEVDDPGLRAEYGLDTGDLTPPMVHPFAADVPVGGPWTTRIDYNCDGWPNHRFLH